MKKLFSNKFYIISVSACALIMLLIMMFQGIGKSENTDSSSSSDSNTVDSSFSNIDTSDIPDDSTENNIEQIMNADIKNDSSVIASIPYSVDTFGEYTMIAEKSGMYSFTAKNVDGAETKVSWNIYILDEPNKFGSNYLLKNSKPDTSTDGKIAIYRGQYVYCICSLNQFNYDNTSVLAYLKISLINEVDDSSRKEHVHKYEVKTNASDCVKGGYIIYECECGDTYIESVGPKDHELEKVETPPTCTEAGFTTYTCKKCGYTYQEPGKPATGHVFKNSGITATSSGHEYLCSVCGKTISEDHTFSDTAFITGMTDNSGNIQYYRISLRQVCSVCQYSMPLENLDVVHTAKTYTYIKSTQILTFTCDDCGRYTYKCSVYLDYEIIESPDENTSSVGE